MAAALESWLEESEEHEHKWEEAKFTMQEQRVLLTQLVGSVYNLLDTDKYKDMGSLQPRGSRLN